MKRILALILIALFCAGCAHQSNGSEDTLQVTASFYPVWVLASNVVGQVPGVELACMTDAQTGCLHHYQLQSNDMKTLEATDLFLLGGAGMEAFLQQVTSQFPELTVVDTSKGLALIAEDDEVNPHVWLDVDCACQMVKEMASALSEACPEHEQEFCANADAYCKRLTDLKDEMKASLAACTCRKLITSHDAFVYFARCFDFELLAVVAEDEESEPSPAKIQELTEIIRNQKLPAIFCEPDTTSAATDTLSRETGAKLVVLDPVTTGEWEPDAYETAMRKNAAALLEAMQ